MQYEKIADDEGIDYSKNKNISKLCDVCGFWSFISENFNYEGCACNGSHDLLISAYSLDNIAILKFNDTY